MDKKIILGIIQEEIERKGSVEIKVFGGSMNPVIKDKAVVLVRKAKNIKVGDIVCYKTSGWFLVHRVKAIDAEKDILTIEGDSRDCVVHKVKRSAMLGVVKENIYNKLLRVPAELMKKAFKKKGTRGNTKVGSFRR